MLAGHLTERAAQGGDLGMDVETVDGVDAEGEDFLGIGLDAARRGGKDGHVDCFELTDVAHDGIGGQFGGLLARGVATDDAGHFEVGRSLQRLEHIFSDIAVTYHGGSDLFHRFSLLNGYLVTIRVQSYSFYTFSDGEK